MVSVGGRSVAFNVALQGPQGEQGEQGETGPQGPQGEAGVVTTPLRLGAGDVNTPTYSFSAGPSAGLYAASGTTIAIASNGAEVMRWLGVTQTTLAQGSMIVTSTLTCNGNITLVPPASAVPGSNGVLTFQATSNTQLTFKFRGSDGVTRSASLTLS